MGAEQGLVYSSVPWVSRQEALDVPPTRDEIRVLPYMLRACALSMTLWNLDQRIAGSERHDENLVGVLPYLAWLQSSGEEYVDPIVE